MHIDIGMKYRDRNEITVQILESANGNGVRLSKIKGLIEYLDGERIFKTTEKGMNFLRIHNIVQELSPLTTNLQKREEMVSYL